MQILEDDFTLEAWMKKPRRVVRWRGRKFVVRDPWNHVAVVYANGVKTRYVNGVQVPGRIPLEDPPLTGLVDELRLSKVARSVEHFTINQRP